MENAENKQAPGDAYDQQPPTQGFPAFQQVPQPAAPPGDPRWLAPPAARRRRTPAVLAVILGLAVALVVGFVVGFVTDDDDSGGPNPLAERMANGAQTGQPANNADNPAQQQDESGTDGAPAAAGGGGSEFDLRKGAVFLQSNDATANQVVAFARAEDGKLREVGRYDTGGVGSGSFEDSAQGIVLGTSRGEASPTHNIDSAQLLFVTNAGSNSVSVFRVNSDGLELVGATETGGEKPVSVTVNNGLVYVLNSGELDDRLLLNNDPTQFIENCATGEPPTVTGFRVDGAGKLTAIPNSTRPLSGSQTSGCAQVQFTPDGSQLVVTERVASLPSKTPENGAIVTFQVGEDGTLGAKKVMDSSGTGPFGFSFTRDGTLLVTEQHHVEEAASSTSSYTMRDDGSLKPISRAVPNQATDSCWVVATNDGRLAFVSSAFGGGTISSYRMDDAGALTLLQANASAVEGQDPSADNTMDGTTDLAISRDDKFVYQLNSIFGVLDVFQVADNGKLTWIEEHKVFDLPTPDKGGQLPPFGIAAF